MRILSFLTDPPLVVAILEGLELQELIQLWHDRLIGVGEDWYAEIEGALTAARVAIVLVSKNFLASRFCQEEEFPYLMQRHRRGEIVVLPLLIDDCLWEEHPWLPAKQLFLRMPCP